MIEERVRFALDKFLIPDYFATPDIAYELIEHAHHGKSILKLNVGTLDNLCKQNYDTRPPRFSFIRTDDPYGIDKCVDHFVLRKCSDCWELHMFEMKTTLGSWTWDGVRRQMRASYLKIRALAVFLGIELLDSNIFTYTTYENVDFSIRQTTNPRAFLPSLGGRALDIENTEWLANCIYLPITVSDETNEPQTFVKLSHHGIQMHRTKDGYLEGEFTL